MITGDMVVVLLVVFLVQTWLLFAIVRAGVRRGIELFFKDHGHKIVPERQEKGRKE